MPTSTEAYKEVGADLVTGAEAGMSAEEQRMQSRINVGYSERKRSIYIGGLLVALIFLRMSLREKLGLLLGALLIQRGLTGSCAVYRRFGISTARPTELAGLKVEKVIRVERPARELFGFWRHLENLPRIMPHLESVQEKSERLSHWVVKGPAGKRLEWDAEIISEHPGEMIAWKSLPGAEVQSAGSVRFKAVDGATEVKVAMQYQPPGGQFGEAIASFLGQSPEQQLEDDLRRFKEMMEQRA